MIKLENVSHYYGNKKIINDVTIEIPKGDMIFITGSSGAGKSTLLRLISGHESPIEGNVLIGGNNTRNLSPNEILALRREVATIFQDPLLLNDLTIEKNIALPLEILGFKQKYINKRINSAMKRLNLIDKAQNSPNNLSVGQKQRVSIARALVHKPKIILADEPTGNLDFKVAHDVLRLLERFKHKGATVIVVSHDLHLIKQFNYRVLVIANGSIAAELNKHDSIDKIKSNFNSSTQLFKSHQ